MCTNGDGVDTKRKKGYFGATETTLDFDPWSTITKKTQKNEHFCERNRFKRYKIEENSKRTKKMETIDLE